MLYGFARTPRARQRLFWPKAFVFLTLLSCAPLYHADEAGQALSKRGSARTQSELPVAASGSESRKAGPAGNDSSNRTSGASANITEAFGGTPTDASKAGVVHNYGRLPLSFEPNLGQVRGDDGDGQKDSERHDGAPASAASAAAGASLARWSASPGRRVRRRARLLGVSERDRAR